MPKSDDSTLDPEDLRIIRTQAERLLRKADALGQFPTPVDEILASANVEVGPADALDEGFLRRMRRKAKDSLKRAFGKVLGVLDAVGLIAYFDRGIYVVKRRFLQLHEAAHAWLPAHRKAYRVVEDSDKELSSEVSDLFDRQANTFASEVLFQLDEFSRQAADYNFGFDASLKLSKRFGASIYASVRKYVSQNHRACAVLVLNCPKLTPGHGYVCTLRRFVVSTEFTRRFGSIDWPEEYTPSDPIGKAIPLAGRKMSGRFTIVLRDRNGQRHECVAEGFTQTHQVFVLICPVKALTKVSVVIP
jgi:hypothetical protein